MLTGTAAANQAGPAITMSYLAAGLACAFAALCYADFASMIPIAGSAHTYAYATLGELVAWTIGWDLVLEYAAGAMTVAIGWSGHMQPLLACPCRPGEHIDLRPVLESPQHVVTTNRRGHAGLHAVGGGPLDFHPHRRPSSHVLWAQRLR